MAVINNTAPASDREKRVEEPVLREEVFSMGSSFFDIEKGLKTAFIEWEDSYGAAGGWMDLDGYKPELLICYSAGIVIYEDEKVVALAPNFAPSTTYTPKQGNGLMVIPKSCIRKFNSSSP